MIVQFPVCPFFISIDCKIALAKLWQKLYFFYFP